MMLYLIPILTALTLFVAVAGVYYLHARSRRFTDRLQRVVDTEDPPPPGFELMDEPLPIWLRLISFFAWLLPGQIFSETLQWELARAGYRHTDARKVFVGARVLSTVLLGLSGVLATWHFRLAMQEALVVSATCAGAGYILPVVVLRMREARRQEEITLSLPDALDLLVICVEAGQGLNAALLKVGRESELHAKALSEELRSLNNEMRAGVTRAQALRNFAMRTGVDDVRALTAVMIQSDRFGTSIAQALRTHAESLRIRRRQRAEERARKTPVKLVFPLVFCIFPELLVVILAPGMLELFRALAKMADGE